MTGARFSETAAESADPSPAEQHGDGLEKVEDKVLDIVERGRTTTFWVRFAEEADLSGAAAIEDWAERGAYVVDQLRATADASRAAVRAELAAIDTPYTSYWVTNAVRVTGDAAVVKELADEPAVTEILAPTVYRLPDPVAGVDQNTVSAVEWGIARIARR